MNSCFLYFKKAILEAFKYSGRSSRGEYWCFTGVIFLFNIFTNVVLSILFNELQNNDIIIILAIVYIVISLVLMFPTVSLMTRRLHDINMSGWWQLIMLIPIAGPLALLILFLKKGDIGENRFGVEPNYLI